MTLAETRVLLTSHRPWQWVRVSGLVSSMQLLLTVDRHIESMGEILNRGWKWLMENG